MLIEIEFIVEQKYSKSEDLTDEITFIVPKNSLPRIPGQACANVCN